MKMIRYIFLSAILLISLGVRAQLSIHISPHVLDTLAQQSYPLTSGGTPVNGIPLDITLTNPSNFNSTGDSLVFGYSVSQGGLTRRFTSDRSDSSGFYFAKALVQIPAGGSATYRVIVHFSSPAFVVGSSIVVIWPIITGQPVTVDSARGVIVVTAPDTTTASVNDLNFAEAKAYLSGTDLIVKGVQNNFGELRIYSIIGQQMYFQKISGDSRVPLQSLLPGIYIIEATLNDGRHLLTRVLKAE